MASKPLFSNEEEFARFVLALPAEVVKETFARYLLEASEWFPSEWEPNTRRGARVFAADMQAFFEATEPTEGWRNGSIVYRSPCLTEKELALL